MKLLKNAKAPESFRKIVNDDKTKVLAVVGTVEDLMSMGILEYCSLPGECWCCIPADCSVYSDFVGFGFTRQDAIDRVNYGLGLC